MRRSHLALFVVSLLFAPAMLPSQVPLARNTDFESGATVASSLVRPTPADWNAGGTGYEIGLDSLIALSGRRSLRTSWSGREPWTSGSGRFAVASQVVALNAVRGRRVRLTGYIRTENIADGYAGFWMRVDAGSRVIAFDNMQARPVRGTTPWTRYEIELPVDSGATTVIVGALHPGNGTAWFDSLSVSVVGTAMPRTVADVPPFVAAPRPAEPLDRLLTDSELAVPVDSLAAPVSKEWTDWVRENARPVRSLTAPVFDDLQFLKPILKDKRLVQLGESGHGVQEFNLAKVRLIRFLHEEMGYDVIAFESSIFECHHANAQAKALGARALMLGCIFGVWHTQENVPLFEYIKETQATGRPLVLAGFDEQVSASVAVRQRPDFLASLVGTIDTAYARQVRLRDADFISALQTSGQDRVKSEGGNFIPFYDSLATWISTHAVALGKDSAAREAVIVARQVARSMQVYIRQLRAGPTPQGTDIRDLGMADNLDVLMKELYPGKRVMVWAHNFHIQHRGTRAATPDSARAAPVGLATMGSYVVQRHRPDLYTIGLYMYRGSSAMNNRVHVPVARMPAGSMESILHQSRYRYSFVDMLGQSNRPATSWMFTRRPAYEWGMQPQQIVPRAEFDGILFIDETHPPRYTASW